MDRRQFVKGALGVVAGLRTGVVPFRKVGHIDVFDVRRYGAAGDGRTDDTTAFERALTAAGSVAGVVAVPPGRYLTSRMLRVPSRTSLRGEGNRSVIERRKEGDRIAVATIGTTGVSIEGVAIVGEMSHGLLIEHASSVQVDRCSVAGATIERSSYSSGILIVDSSDVTVRRCRCSGNGGEGALQGADIQVEGSGGKSSRIHILENDCASTHVAVNIRCFDMAGSTIADNAVQGARRKELQNHGYGILIYQTAHNPGSCFDNAVLRNRVSHTDGSGIYLQQSHHSVVADNTIDDVGRNQDDTTLPVAGVALNLSNFTSVRHNTISKSGRAGISASSDREGAGHVAIEDNVIRDIVGPGIQLRGLLTDVSVRRNRIAYAGGGIVSFNDDAQNGLVILDNRVADCHESGGIVVKNARASQVSANTVRRCGGTAIDVTFVDGASVAENNTVIDGTPGTTSAAIRVRRVRSFD